METECRQTETQERPKGQLSACPRGRWPRGNLGELVADWLPAEFNTEAQGTDRSQQPPAGQALSGRVPGEAGGKGNVAMGQPAPQICFTFPHSFLEECLPHQDCLLYTSDAADDNRLV